VVINEVLTFIDNKKDVMDDESLSLICVSAFSESDIEEAKNLLFESIPTKKRKIVRKKDSRKKDGKALKDLDDIICLLRDTHSEDIPVFAARALEKLPPVLWDHVDVTRILKDIVNMQRDISLIKKDYANREDLDQLKSEMEALKDTSVVNTFALNVNSRRGGYLRDSFECQSGPMGLSPVPLDNHKEPSVIPLQESAYRDIGQTLTSRSKRSPLRVNLPADSMSEQRTVTMTHPIISQLSESPPPQMPTVKSVITDCVGHTDGAPVQLNGPTEQCIKNVKSDGQTTSTSALSSDKYTKSTAEITREGNWRTEVPNEEWIQVQRKRLRNRFSGHRGKAFSEPGNNFRAAEIKIPLFIYNVAKGVSVSDITGYIKNKCQVDVNVEKVKMRIAKDYESYKVFVPKYKLNIFMSEDFWPEGVAYRRFIDFKYREKGSALKAGVLAHTSK
jgi:ribosomal protein S15P/S13E